MIVKFFKNSGGGSAKATMNYLLGKENDREGARLLSGDPELTKRLSDSLNFQNRYTVGVLSFEEVNLPDEDKRAIMESFEGS
ncbi:relaxase/mobilization nuclease domain-containing protein, partial [Psychrobacter sp. AOP1-A1-57]